MILGNEDFDAYRQRVAEVFDAWRKRHKRRLSGIGAGGHPREIIDILSEDLLARFADLPLLDRYDVYQRLMDYWDETMQDDVYLVAAAGWVEAARPRAVVEDRERKIRETPDLTVKRRKYKMDLIPPALVVARWFAAEQAGIEALRAARETAARELDEFVEEHSSASGGEEGLLADATNDRGKVTRGGVAARLRALRDEDAPPDRTRCLRLPITEKPLRRQPGWCPRGRVNCYPLCRFRRHRLRNSPVHRKIRPFNPQSGPRFNRRCLLNLRRRARRARLSFPRTSTRALPLAGLAASPRRWCNRISPAVARSVLLCPRSFLEPERGGWTCPTGRAKDVRRRWLCWGHEFHAAHTPSRCGLADCGFACIRTWRAWADPGRLGDHHLGSTRTHLFYQLLTKDVQNTGYNRHFKLLLDLTFTVPSQSEQTAIAAVLSDMDAEVAVLERRLDKVREVKQGMMQQLLTGRVRLV